MPSVMVARLLVVSGSLLTVISVLVMWWSSLGRTESPYRWPREPRAMQPTRTSRVLVAAAAVCVVTAVVLYLVWDARSTV